MRYEPSQRLLRLALMLAGSRLGLTLDEIARDLGVGRRTAERLRDSLAVLFPQLEIWDDEARSRRWRLPVGALVGLAEPRTEAVAAVEAVAHDCIPIPVDDDDAEWDEQIATELAFIADIEARAARHAPLRAAFLGWLRQASGRFARPVSATPAWWGTTSLHVEGLHPAVDIRLEGDCGINVYVTWAGEAWDILRSFDVVATSTVGGWHNLIFSKEYRHIYPTREACWCGSGFDDLLIWFNEDLAPATHLVLHGEPDRATTALLVRGGVVEGAKRLLDGSAPPCDLLALYA